MISEFGKVHGEASTEGRRPPRLASRVMCIHVHYNIHIHIYLHMIHMIYHYICNYHISMTCTAGLTTKKQCIGHCPVTSTGTNRGAQLQLGFWFGRPCTQSGAERFERSKYALERIGGSIAGG